MNANVSTTTVAAIIVVLVAAVGILSYKLYEENRQPDGVEISIGSKGVSVENK